MAAVLWLLLGTATALAQDVNHVANATLLNRNTNGGTTVADFQCRGNSPNSNSTDASTTAIDLGAEIHVNTITFTRQSGGDHNFRVGWGTSQTGNTLSGNNTMGSWTLTVNATIRYIFFNHTNMAQNDANAPRIMNLAVWGPSLAPTTIAISDASNVTVTTATLNANVTSTETVTARGFRYGIGNPGTPSDSWGTNVALGTGTGPITTNLTGLTTDQTYYFYAYATSNGITYYSEVKSFLAADCQIKNFEICMTSTRHFVQGGASVETGRGNSCGENLGSLTGDPIIRYALPAGFCPGTYAVMLEYASDGTNNDNNRVGTTSDYGNMQVRFDLPSTGGWGGGTGNDQRQQWWLRSGKTTLTITDADEYIYLAPRGINPAKLIFTRIEDCAHGTEPKTEIYGLSFPGGTNSDIPNNANWNDADRIWRTPYGAGEFIYKTDQRTDRLRYTGTNDDANGGGLWRRLSVAQRDSLVGEAPDVTTRHRLASTNDRTRYIEWTNVNGGRGGYATLLLVTSNDDNCNNRIQITVNGVPTYVQTNSIQGIITDAARVQRIALTAGTTNTIRLVGWGNNNNVVGFILRFTDCAEPLCDNPATPELFSNTTCAGESLFDLVDESTMENGVDYYWQISPTGEVADDTYAVAEYGTTYYLRVFNGECWSDVDETVTVTVLPSVATAGTVSPSSTQEVMQGGTAGLTLTGYAGTIAWQMSTDNEEWTSVGGSSATLSLATGVIGTFYYRAVVTVNCDGDEDSATSNTVTVVVKDPSFFDEDANATPCVTGTYVDTNTSEYWTIRSIGRNTYLEDYTTGSNTRLRHGAANANSNNARWIIETSGSNRMYRNVATNRYLTMENECWNGGALSSGQGDGNNNAPSMILNATGVRREFRQDLVSGNIFRIGARHDGANFVAPGTVTHSLWTGAAENGCIGSANGVVARNPNNPSSGNAIADNNHFRFEIIHFPAVSVYYPDLIVSNVTITSPGEITLGDAVTGTFTISNTATVGAVANGTAVRVKLEFNGQFFYETYTGGLAVGATTAPISFSFTPLQTGENIELMVTVNSNYTIEELNCLNNSNVAITLVDVLPVPTTTAAPLKEFHLKWSRATDATGGGITHPTSANDGSVNFSSVSIDQTAELTNCLEVYFELNEEYAHENHVVTLVGNGLPETELFVAYDTFGNVLFDGTHNYICFSALKGWSGTIHVYETQEYTGSRQRAVSTALGERIASYSITIPTDVTTDVNNANADRIVKTVNCYTVTGVEVPCNVQGVIIKRITYTDGSTNMEKELK